MVNYRQYINSIEWQRKRLCVPKKQCYCCGKSTSVILDLHHKTYRTLGNEAKDHLCWVCRECHLLIHKYVKYDRVSIWYATIHVRELMQHPDIQADEQPEPTLHKKPLKHPFDDRKKYRLKDPRLTLSMAHFGDPRPGCSALDKKRKPS